MTSRRVTLVRTMGWIAASVLVLLPVLVRADPTSASLRVGFAKCKIELPPMCQMTGFGDTGAIKAEGTADPLYARATVLEQSTTRVAVVSLDVFAVDAALRQQVLDRAKPLKLTDVVLAATGTKRGPGGLLRARRWARFTGTFRSDVARAVLDAIQRALSDAAKHLAPATVAFQPIGKGPGNVAVFQTQGGEVRGVWLGLAGRRDTSKQTGNSFSAGAAGRMCDAIETKWPQRSVQVLQGPVADLNDVRRESLVKSMMDGIARAISRGANDSPKLGISTRFAALHTPWRRVLDNPDAPVLTSPKPWHLPVTTLSIGTHTLRTVPGEIAKAEMDASPVWSVTYANGYGGTFIGSRRYPHLAPNASRCITGPETVHELLRAPDAPTRRASFRTKWVSDVPHITRIAPSTPKRRDAKASDAYRLGHAHGTLLRDDIHAFLVGSETALTHAAHATTDGPLRTWIDRYGGQDPRAYVLLELIQRARTLIPHIPHAQLDEMEGIADAAGVPFDSILLINTFLTLAEQTDANRLLALPARCTNVVVHERATSMGQLLHASTLDWALRDLLAPSARVLLMEPAGGNTFMSVSWPGMVGTLRAMSAEGIAITEESTAAPKDTRVDGTPLPLLMRDVVQHASTLNDAVKRLRRARGTCGYKVTVSDGNQLDARVVALTARHSHVRKPLAGILQGVLPNAPVSAFVGARNREIPQVTGSSLKRYGAFTKALTQLKQPLRRADVQTLISDPSLGIRGEGTLFACVFEPSARRATVALDLRDGKPPAWQSIDLRAIVERNVSPMRRGMPCVPEQPTMIKQRDRAFTLIKNATRWSLVFSSPRPSGHAFNDSVKAELWLPKQAKGVVIHLPAWKEPTLAAHRLLASQLARAGIATAILPLPYQASRAAPGESSGAWTLSANLARTRSALVQGLADALALSRLLEDEFQFEPARQGVTGVSLGAHVAAVAYGAYPNRFSCGGFILGGGNVHEAFMKKNSVTGKIYAELTRRGVTLREAGDLMRGMDPLHHADPKRRDGILLIAADADDVVAPANVELLAKAYGGAKITWLSGGHYAPANPLMAVKVISALRAHLLGRLKATAATNAGPK